jgi:hypothetical protein
VTCASSWKHIPEHNKHLCAIFQVLTVVMMMIVLFYVLFLSIVLFYVERERERERESVLLPPSVNPTAVKYIIHSGMLLCCWVNVYQRLGGLIVFTFKIQAVKGEFLHLVNEGTKIVPYTRQIWRPFLSTLVGLRAVTGPTTSDVRSILHHKFRVTNHTSTLLLLRPQRVNESLCQKAL